MRDFRGRAKHELKAAAQAAGHRFVVQTKRLGSFDQGSIIEQMGQRLSVSVHISAGMCHNDDLPVAAIAVRSSTA